jgi:hypothetical protein
MFISGLTIGIAIGIVLTILVIRATISAYERCNPDARRDRLHRRSRYDKEWAPCVKRKKAKQWYKQMTDAEVARVISVRDHKDRMIVAQWLPPRQLNTMIKRLTGEPKDFLKLEKIRREFEADGE